MDTKTAIFRRSFCVAANSPYHKLLRQKTRDPTEKPHLADGAFMLMRPTGAAAPPQVASRSIPGLNE